jgi:DNA-binding NtrC family response regulator
MNAHLVLLHTRDHDFEKLLTEALGKSGATILVARNVADTLEIGCTRGAELDFAVIDRDDCHAITLLSAINACYHELPIVVVTSSESCHCTAVAYANGAAACLAKPITATEIELVLSKLGQPKLQLTAA